jgi:hypothetical protein
MQYDWTASPPDFRIACSVLLDKQRQALNDLRKLGKSGEYISEDAYLEWPLFDDLRRVPEFAEIYKSIYRKDLEKEITKRVMSTPA